MMVRMIRHLFCLLMLAAFAAGCGDSQGLVMPQTQQPVIPPPAGRLVVANYDHDNILVFDLGQVVNGQVNNIPPSLVISGTDTIANHDLAGAGDDAVWYTTENGDLYLFSDLDNNNGTASRTLAPNFQTLSVSYDGERDILYSDSTAGAFNVGIFDNALALPNNSEPTRSLPGFPGPVETLTLDPIADRLYVIVAAGPASHELHVFEGASGLTGDMAGIMHAVTSFELATPIFGASYDATNDRLWFGEYNDIMGVTATFFFIDQVAGLGATTTVNSVGTGAASEWFWDTLYDAPLNRLFVSNASLSGQSEGSICIYNSPGSIPTGNGAQEPDTLIAGPSTLINDVSGVALLR